MLPTFAATAHAGNISLCDSTVGAGAMPAETESVGNVTFHVPDNAPDPDLRGSKTGNITIKNGGRTVKCVKGMNRL